MSFAGFSAGQPATASSWASMNLSSIPSATQSSTRMRAITPSCGSGFSGGDAFKLYDTYGVPIDLTIEMVQEQGMAVNVETFKALMEEQKIRARKAREALGDLGWAGVEFGKEVPETQFVGYDHTAIDDAKVVAIVAEGELVDEIVTGVEAIVVLDKTPFYAEMGGQVADHGVLLAEKKGFEVSDVQ